MTRRRIDIEEISQDVRSGLGDVPIMEKYHLDPGEYRWLLEKLKEFDAIDSEDFHNRMLARQSEMDAVQKRAIPRNYLLYNIAVYDATNLNLRGVVTDLTKEGLQVLGINAQVGETRSFLIRTDLFPSTTSFGFDALCRWTRTDRVSGEPSAGFEITSISRPALRELSKITSVLGVSEASTERPAQKKSRW